MGLTTQNLRVALYPVVSAALLLGAALFIVLFAGIAQPTRALAGGGGSSPPGNCCPDGGGFSPGAPGQPSFCIVINPDGSFTQTPAPASCGTPDSLHLPFAQIGFRQWFMEQEQEVLATIVNYEMLSNFFGVPGGIYIREMDHAGMSDPFLSHNSFGGGFLGSSIHDDGGTITSGGTSSPGLGNTTTSFGFELHDIYDASQWVGLGPDRQLLLGGFFFYQHDRTAFDSVISGGPNAAFISTNDYTFMGAVAYRQGRAYIIGQAGGNFGPNSFSDDTGGSGNYSSSGFTSDLTVGYNLPLVNPMTSNYGLNLDISGHGGYLTNASGSFIESNGTAFGPGNVSSGIVGGQAKLVAAFPGGGLAWSPFIGLTVDDWIDARDTVGSASLHEGDTFWGGEAGVNVTAPNGVNVGVNGFYRESSTIRFAGGMMTFKVPFGAF